MAGILEFMGEHIFLTIGVIVVIAYFSYQALVKRECFKCHKKTRVGNLEVCSDADCHNEVCDECKVECENCSSFCSDAHFDKHECDEEEEDSETEDSEITYLKDKEWAYFNTDGVDCQEVVDNIVKIESEGYTFSFCDNNGYVFMRKNKGGK